MGGIFASLIDGTGLSSPGIVARGMSVTFAVASALILLALVIVIFGRRSTEASAND
jgi:hypothetical protein